MILAGALDLYILLLCVVYYDCMSKCQEFCCHLRSASYFMVQLQKTRLVETLRSQLFVSGRCIRTSVYTLISNTKQLAYGWL